MPTFLRPLTLAAPAALVLRNRRTGGVIATRILPAVESETRRTGLLKHQSLPEGEAMIIAPSNAVHTFFMRFPIDIAFVDQDGTILKIKARVPAWRIAAAWGGYAVIEMAAGEFARSGTAVGDAVELALLRS